MVHRENQAADRRRLITQTQQDFGGVIHPGKWQHLRAKREQSRRQKAEQAAAEKKRKNLKESQTDEEREREVWNDIVKILETNDDEDAETRDKTVSWASAIEVLGSWISADGSNERDLCERLRKARKLWRAVLARLPKLSLTKKMKGNVVKSTVLASLLNGCEVQVDSAKQLQVMQGFIKRVVRDIALKKGDGIREMKGKATMTDLRLQVGIDHVEVYIALDGVWPEGLLDASIAMIPKVDEDCTLFGQRPLCVLTVIYRLQASVRLEHLTGWFQSWMPDSVFSAGGARSSEEAWYPQPWKLRRSLLGRATLMCIFFAADVVKPFDTADRGILSFVLGRLGAASLVPKGIFCLSC